MLRYVVTGIVVGVAVELFARMVGLWRYHQPQTPLLNVVIVYGLIMGGLASLVRPLGWGVVVGSAFGVGLLYEIVNLRVLKWWEFPEERLAFIHGHTAIVVVLACLWGLVPAVIVSAQAVLPAALRTPTAGGSRLERLNERERVLAEKLDALHARTRAVETQLEGVRALRQTLLDRQAVRQPGTREARPGPTP